MAFRHSSRIIVLLTSFTVSLWARPNFIIIYTDDQGYGDLSSYGHTGLSTPEIDQMAAEGMRMTSFYSGYPICTPSRAALLTGYYPERLELGNNMHGHANDVIFPPDDFGLNPNEVTLADLLKANGYATGIVGKWHLGHRDMFLPTKQGFDYYFGIPYSNDMRPTDLIFMEENIDVLEWTNPNVPDGQDSLTHWYTDSALAFIDRNKDSSFFMYVAHSMPHWPVFASESFQGNTSRTYDDVIEEISFNVGRLLDGLKTLGLDSNTLVMFSSDNGASAGSNAPLKGGKQDNFEGGMRVPGVFRWPGTIPPGQVSDEVGTVLDIYTTFANLAGVNLPAGYQSDGEDITGILMGEPGATRSTPFYYELSAIRVGEFKYTQNSRDNNQFTNNVETLHNVVSDMGESTDISGANSALADSLKARLEAFSQDLNNNIRPRGELSTVVLKQGCIDDAALNYDSDAGVDNGTCVYELSTKPIYRSKEYEIVKNNIRINSKVFHTAYVYDIRGNLIFQKRVSGFDNLFKEGAPGQGVNIVKLKGLRNISFKWIR